ncbi:MAG: hypothetical protein OK452_10050 [Thaumarchaeota archaeon]|nr:hypothetical protein [Nitrososphaerota archaeon]
MKTERARLGWYAFTAVGFAVLVLLVASVVGPQVLSGLAPKYKVVFFQTPTCGDYDEYALPWAVTLGSTTIQKGGATLPYDGNRELHGITDSNDPLLNQTIIVFSVPNGNYNYKLMPWRDFLDPDYFPQGIVNGTIHVDGSSVLVNVTVANPGQCGF